MILAALFVSLVVFGPLLVLVPALLLLCGIGWFSGDGPRVVRCTFRCPARRQTVTADVAVPVGATQPGLVVACSAFAEPTRVTCAQRCLTSLTARWSAPVSVLGRWALTADGVEAADGKPLPRSAASLAA